MYKGAYDMKIKAVTVGMFATNCYLVYCPKTAEGIIVDPGANGKLIASCIKELKIKLKYLINTHGHIDHIGANRKIKEDFKVPILLSENDLQLYHNPGYGLSFVLKKQPAPDWFVNEGDELRFGECSLTIVTTPGHTPGGVSLIGNNELFCGDTLFAGSIGRTDLPGGSYPTLIKSIKERLMTLPGHLNVYPGHGPATTISEEAESNVFIT